MSITTPILNTIDLGVGGTVSSPTKQYTALNVDSFEPKLVTLAGARTNADGSIDKPPTPIQLTWTVKMFAGDYPDYTAFMSALDKLFYFFANQPQFIRGNTAAWVQRHSTSWIQVVALGALPATRDANLYAVQFELQECLTITITAP